MNRLLYKALNLGIKSQVIVVMYQVNTSNNSYADRIQRTSLIMRKDIMSKHYEDAIPSWITLAKAGDVHAQFNLGYMYGEGLGVIRDSVESYAWFNVAAAQGHRIARLTGGGYKEEMTYSQLDEAQELSKVYYKKYAK